LDSNRYAIETKQKNCNVEQQHVSVATETSRQVTVTTRGVSLRVKSIKCNSAKDGHFAGLSNGELRHLYKAPVL